MFSLIVAGLVFALGGIVKGIMGAGAPVVIIPGLAMLYDVKVAVAIMMVPNLITNIWQIWQWRESLLPNQFIWSFALSGAVGAGVGSWLLAILHPSTLSLIVAAAVFLFVLFRLLHSNWVLPYATAVKISIPIGSVAGILQGATGISAPVSVSFFNAMQLERTVFIASISLYFITMTLVQIPALASLGILTWHHLFLGTCALAPMLLSMRVGRLLGQRFSKAAFDKTLLVLLVLLALKLVHDNV